MNALASVFGKMSRFSQLGSTGQIGLHCTLRHIHMVQLELDGEGQISLRANASIPFSVSRDASLQSLKEMRALIRGALTSAPFRGRRVISSLPAADTSVMSVTYRVNAGQSETAAILQVMKDRVSEPISNYVLDYLKVRSEQEGSEQLAIVAVAEHQAVVNYLEILRKCSLLVERLEIGPVAIHRLVSALCSQDNYENAIAINFGQEASYITVVSGRRLLLDQEIPLGENKFLDDIATTLELSRKAALELVERSNFQVTDEHNGNSAIRYDLELSDTLKEIVKPRFLQLIEEINRTLVYVASQTRGEPVKRIFLLGSLASWEGVGNYLNSLLQLRVETIANPLGPYVHQKDPEAVASPEIAVATGLALGGMLHGK